MTALLTAAQQVRISSALAARLPDSCQVVRATATNVAGSQHITWANHGAPVGCLLSPWIGRTGGIETVLMERFETVSIWKVALPAGTDVTEADRLIIGGRTFEVKAVAAPESLEVLRECICVERRGEEDG